MEQARADAAVRKLIQRIVNAWNKDDMKDYVACFLPEVLYVPMDGSPRFGQVQLARRLSEYRATIPGSQVALKTVRITHPIGGVAVAAIEGALIVPRSQSQGFYWVGTNTMVLTPSGEWLCACQQTAPLAREARHWFAIAWERIGKGLHYDPDVEDAPAPGAPNR